MVVVAGPCGACGQSKHEAIRPLLEVPSLKVWTDLMLDVGTAQKLLAPTA